MNRVRIVSRETLRNHLKSKSFWVMIFMPLLIMALSLGIGFLTANSAIDSMHVAVDDELIPYFDEERFEITDEAELKRLREDGDISSYATVKLDNGQVVADIYEGSASMSDILVFQNSLAMIQNEINLDKAGLSNDQLTSLNKEPLINNITDDQNDDRMIGRGIYFILMMLMYFVLMSFINVILTETATEKGTKMIEFIFSSVRPGDYFRGKIEGNFIAALIQIGAYVIFGIIAFLIAKSRGLFNDLDLSFSISGNTAGMVAIIVVLFLLGILISLIAAGMLGSFATKVEDAGKMASPLIIAIVGIFILAMTLQGRGDILPTKILSYIPFASTFFMPLRLLNGYGSLVEGVISIAILLVAILLMYRFGERVYKNNILNYSTDKLFGRKKS